MQDESHFTLESLGHARSTGGQAKRNAELVNQLPRPTGLSAVEIIGEAEAEIARLRAELAASTTRVMKEMNT